MNALTKGPHPIPASSRPALWHSGRCTVCGHDDLREFLHLPSVPAQDGLVWSTREEALAAPSGEIRLMLCRRCGYAGNRAYDAARVGFAGYDVSLEYSGQYRAFVRELAARLVETYGVRGKTVLEIACGKGFFLRTICRIGGNRGIGYDPAYADEGSDTEVVMRPQQFDVVVPTNQFGVILTDEGAGLVGGLGLAPGLCIGDRQAMAQATHGSAPDIAGQNIANPYSMIMSGKMLLDWLGRKRGEPKAVNAAQRIEAAVERVIAEAKHLTRDLGGTASTTEMGGAIAAAIK